MNLSAEFELPKWSMRVCCVYEIKFDSGKIYIGSTNHLRRRFISWKYFFKTDKAREQWSNMAATVNESASATMRIICLCDNGESARETENSILIENKDNELLINKYTELSKPVIKLSKMGDVVEEYYSISEAALKNNCKIGHIQRVINGERNSIGGFVYRSEGYKQTARVHDFSKLNAWKEKQKLENKI